jgi:hypothetical protein
LATGLILSYIESACIQNGANMFSKTSWDDQAQRWLRQGFSLGAKINDLEVWEHCAPGYAKRTGENAQRDATVAIAADYSTGGERLTAQLAGARYIALPFYLDEDEAGKRLAEFMAKLNASSLNVAGNGIETLTKKGWPQQVTNQWVFDCLACAHALRNIDSVQTGGQTGVDMAGAIAGSRLGLPTRVLMPQGFKQRDENGRDFGNDPSALIEMILTSAQALSPWPRQALGQSPKP